MPRSRRSATAPRRGIILLIVLSLLALFAIVAVSFVLYATSEAESARISRDAETITKPDVEPERALGIVLGQLLYGAPDNELGLHTSLRGTDLARLTYGGNDNFGYNLGITVAGNPVPNPDIVAYNGTGRLREGTIPVTIAGTTTFVSITTSALPPGSVPATPPAGVFAFFDPLTHQMLDVNGVPFVNATTQVPFYVDPYELVNYTCFRNGATTPDPKIPPFSLMDRVGPNDWNAFVHDPERLGSRNFDQMTFSPTGPGLTAYLNDMLDQSQLDPVLPTNPARKGPRGLWTGGYNAPYTAPDTNNMFVAKVLSDGRVILPSYWRPNAAFPDLSPTNPAWFDTTRPWLKYLTMRPRPADHAGFPPPEEGPTIDPNNAARWLSPGGDVKNKLDGPGGNDSSWMNINAPVQTAPNGQKYQMMAAILVEPIDNRVNVNVAGNIKGFNPLINSRDHTSNQGLGTWEINLGRVLANGTEWQNLFVGKGPYTVNTAPPSMGRLSLSGRYGPNGAPDTRGLVASAGRLSHPYSQVDVDAANELPSQNPYQQTTNQYLPTQNFRLPGMQGGSISVPFPAYPQGWSNGSTAERTNFPGVYDVYTPGGDDRNFQLSNMEALLRYDGTNSAALGSDLMRLCPVNLVGAPNDPVGQRNAAQLRRLITVLSNELDRPAMSPYWTNNPAGTSTYTSPSSNPTLPPQGNPGGIAFPNPNLRASGTAAVVNVPPGLPSEFAMDWRSLTAALGKVDLNRTLTAYPLALPDPANASTVTQSQTSSSYNLRFDDPNNAFLLKGFADPAMQFKQAQADRQDLANRIYRRFLAVAGLTPVANPAIPTDSELVPRRWLAQFAANIVDFIDEDDISTPFNFYTTADGLPIANIGDFIDAGTANAEIPKYWVFGTELPRVVVNEVLAQTRTLSLTTPAVPTGTRNVRLFIELYNTLGGLPASDPVNSPLQGQDNLPVQLRAPALAMGSTSLKLTGTEKTYFASPAYVPYTSSSDYESYRVHYGSGFYVHSGGTITDFNDNVTGRLIGPGTPATSVDEGFLVNATSGETLTNVDGSPATNGTSIPVGIPGVQGSGGYFLLGPINTAAGYATRIKIPTWRPPRSPSRGAVPATTPVLRSPKMAYVYNPPTGTIPDEAKVGLTVALRRLVNPHIPFDPNPTLTNGASTIVNPWYNPYVTVDYLDKIPIQEGGSTSTRNCVARGRNQPFAGRTNVPVGTTFAATSAPDTTATNFSPVQNQATQDPNLANCYHTFGVLNNPIPNPATTTSGNPYNLNAHF